MRRGLAVAAGAVGVALLAGCGSSDEGTEDQGDAGAVVEDAEAGSEAPEECLNDYPYAVAEADLADIESRPDDWPDPPGGATLCLTAEGGSVETASYVTDTPIEDVFGHYEEQLAASYELQHVSGADNGTGYASLDGGDDALGFQIRESDGGFVIAFMAGAQQ